MFDYDVEKGRIRMYGVIGNYVNGVSVEDLMHALDAMDGRDVTIQLQSEGGDIISGLSMMHMIEDYGGRVEFIFDALVASIATVFPMAADKVVAKKYTKMIIHNPWAKITGDATDLRMHADTLEQFGGDIADIYAARTGQERGYWLGVMNKETIFTPEQALEAGLIDEISGDEAKITDRQAVAMLAPAFPRLQMNVARKRLEIKRLCSNLVDGVNSSS